MDLSVNNADTQCLNRLAQQIHDQNVAAGWWSDRDLAARLGRCPDSVCLKDKPSVLRYAIPTKLALVHSEVSEALEGFRKGLNDDHLSHRQMVEVELADAVIRILDIAGALELDIGGALLEKLAYNRERLDHKPEHRNGPGGKSI